MSLIMRNKSLYYWFTKCSCTVLQLLKIVVQGSLALYMVNGSFMSWKVNVMLVGNAINFALNPADEARHDLHQENWLLAACRNRSSLNRKNCLSLTLKYIRYSEVKGR